MAKDILSCSAQMLTVSLVIHKCEACSSDSRDEAQCWYTLWYIWFVLGLFVIVIAVLTVLYIKHRTKERSRTRRRRRSTRTVPIHIVPTGPPGYMEPSHKPPSYEEATRRATQTSQTTLVPGIIHSNGGGDDYGYQPPHPDETAPTGAVSSGSSLFTATSMRMSTSLSGSLQPQPPPYTATEQGQGHPT